jgi:aubergine-like protein
MPLPKIVFGDLKDSEIILNRGRFRQQKDISPIHFNKDNCMLLTFDNKDLIQLAKGDCDQMTLAGKAFGINFELPQLQKINLDIMNNINKAQIISELQKIDYNHGKKMIIVVLDKRTKHLYPAIKDFIYTQTGLASQFMLHDENQRGAKKKQSLSYYSGVLNQMVVKSNGELFKIKFSEEIDRNPSIIIGIDYSRTKEGTKYVVTSTYNRRFNKVYTDMKINKKSESDEEDEIKNKALIELITGAIDYFKSSNSERKPDTVIIYMKGGTEKQTEKIIRFILPDILKLFSGNKEEKCYEENYKPKLTVFSVNKRTELKFFERAQNGYKNIPVGSIIDQKVVSPDVFEFYLQCPDVTLGTASPIHFLCIYNNNEEISLDDYEKITFYQSFYYWNWSGPVRIPAVLKFAEIANSFSTKNLKNEVLKNLKSTPYYI